MQRNWIGKSRGVELAFGLDEPVANLDVEVYTTLPDTLFGVTYIVCRGTSDHACVGRAEP